MPKTTRKSKANADLNRKVKAAVTKIIGKPEMKYGQIVESNNPSYMGQVVGNASGYYAEDISPTPGQGDSATQRIGDTIQVHGMDFAIQVYQMSAAVVGCKIKVLLVRTTGDQELPADVVDKLLFYNPFSLAGGSPAIYDYNSFRDPAFNGLYKVLKTWDMYVAPDQYTGQGGITNLQKSIKFKKPLQFDYVGGSTLVAKGALYLILLPNSGNMSTVTASTISNIAVTPVNTGQHVNYQVRYTYTDA